jgi:D-3-phosphoglycerate dehydrogenase
VNNDIPGVIGSIGGVLGKNSVNIANFSLGREDQAQSGQPLTAVSVIETDSALSDGVLKELQENKAVKTGSYHRA